MKRVLDHPFERGVYQELAIPTGEFVALCLAALLLLGLFLSPSDLPAAAKTIVADVAAAVSRARTNLESSMEAKASDQRVRHIKELAIASTQRPTRVSSHRHRHHGHRGQTCASCSVASREILRPKDPD
jgi:hypothetical protein